MSKSSVPEKKHVRIEDALRRIPGSSGERYVSVLDYETLEIEFYAPRGMDPQKPHTRDEIYVVLQGHGHFVNGKDRHAFVAGDVMFVPAGVEHRFEEFSDDLQLWAFFINR